MLFWFFHYLFTQKETWACLILHNADILSGAEERHTKMFFNNSESPSTIRLFNKINNRINVTNEAAGVVLVAATLLLGFVFNRANYRIWQQPSVSSAELTVVIN